MKQYISTMISSLVSVATPPVGADPRRRATPCLALVLAAVATGGCALDAGDTTGAEAKDDYDAADASIGSIEEAIIASSDVPFNEEARMVKLDDGNLSCSGSFIRPGLVITADHCSTSTNVAVRTGLTSFDSGRAPKRLDERTVGGGVDIKLVKVSTENNPAANLQLASDCNLLNQSIEVYGRKKDTSSSEDDGFRKRSMTITSIARGTTADGDGPSWTFTTLYTGSVVVPGDSGGPGYVRGRLAGINSGTGLYSSALASICHYRPEIVEAAKQLGFDLNTPLTDSQLRAHCADTNKGRDLATYKNCLSSGNLDYVKDDAAWTLNAQIYCNDAVFNSGVESYNEYWQCLKERDVTFHADANWCAAVGSLCGSNEPCQNARKCWTRDVHITARANGRCLDADVGSPSWNGSQTQIWSCGNSKGNQDWVFLANGSIQNRYDQRCLDANMPNGVSGLVNGTKVQLWDCNGSDAQKWELNRNDGTIRLKVNGRCLDASMPNGPQGLVDGTKVQLWDCWGGVNQQWDLADIGPTLYQHFDYGGYGVKLPEGEYTLADLSSRGILNDDVSSLIVPSRYEIQVFEHGDFAGWSQTYRSNVSALNPNDQISSVKVRRIR